MFLAHEHFDLKDKIILERVKFQPPFKSNSTMHNEACFLHVIKGKSRLHTPKKNLSVNSSDSLVMKCGRYLNNWFENEDGNPNEAVLVHFYPDVLKFVYDDRLPDLLNSSKSINQTPVELVKINELINSYVQSLLFYFENPPLVTDELIKLKVKELILLLANSKSSDRIKLILKDLFNPSQYQFKEMIHEHLFEDLSIGDLAVICGLSLSSFKRKFNEVFQTSPKKYINTKRLHKAKDLLESPNLTIAEIAFDCGFNDPGYFSKSFVLAFGCSPTDFRKRR